MFYSWMSHYQFLYLLSITHQVTIFCPRPTAIISFVVIYQSFCISDWTRDKKNRNEKNPCINLDNNHSMIIVVVQLGININDLNNIVANEVFHRYTKTAHMRLPSVPKFSVKELYVGLVLVKIYTLRLRGQWLLDLSAGSITLFFLVLGGSANGFYKGLVYMKFLWRGS